MRAILAVLALTIPLAAAPAFAEESADDQRSPVGEAVDGVKEGGRAIGHGVRDVTTAIGHGARDTTKAIGHGTRDAVKEGGEAADGFFTKVGHAFRDAWNDLTD